MLRSFVARGAIALPLFWAACVGSRQAHLDAHGVALGGVPVKATASPRQTSDATAGVANGSTLVADHALESRLRRELQGKLANGGAAALEVIESGVELESRLRFALSRILLGRAAEAATALGDLTNETPGCALAWYLLGQVRASEGNASAAASSLRRARELQRQHGLAPHPLLGFSLGRALLQTDEMDEGVRLLREELVAGGQRVAAAELLAEFESKTGDFESALAALDAVLDEVPDEPDLVIAKAGIFADQLRHDEAMALLDRQGHRVSSATLAQTRAVLHRQHGDLTAAVAMLTEAIDKHAVDATMAPALSELQAMRTEIDSERVRRARSSLRVREILGRLRYARQPVERVEAVRMLCKGGTNEVVQATVRWALLDAEDVVRIAAIQAGLPRCDNAVELVSSGLQDRAPLVRSASAAAALRQPPRGVYPLLVTAIERETDPAAFRSLHRALCTVSGRDLDLPFDGERNEAIRQRLAEAWRGEFSRAAKESSGS